MCIRAAARIIVQVHVDSETRVVSAVAPVLVASVHAETTILQPAGSQLLASFSCSFDLGTSGKPPVAHGVVSSPTSTLVCAF